MTAAVDEIDAAFNAALLKDAGAPAPDAGEPAFTPPPPKPDPKPADEKPRTSRKREKPAADEKPRTAPAAPAEGKDYARGLIATGQQFWLALSLNQGVSLGKRKAPDGTVKPLLTLPDTRPYAVVFREHLPVMAKAWSEAANQSPVIRRHVSKFAGTEGEGVSWVLGVGLSSAMFAMGCAQLAKAENAQLRAQLAEKNDADLQQYLQAMLEKMGMAA